MKTTFATMMSLTLMIALGCNSPRGGGVSTDEGFTISTPVLATMVKQGQTQSVSLSVNRGKNFKRDVTLAISSSQGITVEPTNVTVKGSDRPDVVVRIITTRDTNLGEYRVFVKATPEVGQPTETEFTVKVVLP